MNKKGLIGTILLIILGIILIIGIIIGITAFQAYSLVKIVQQETPIIQSSMQQITGNYDCTKIPVAESSINRVMNEAKSACKNPIIEIVVEKINQIPIKCANLTTLESQVSSGLGQMKTYCSNQTLIV